MGLNCKGRVILGVCDVSHVAAGISTLATED